MRHFLLYVHEWPYHNVTQVLMSKSSSYIIQQVPVPGHPLPAHLRGADAGDAAGALPALPRRPQRARGEHEEAATPAGTLFSDVETFHGIIGIIILDYHDSVSILS